MKETEWTTQVRRGILEYCVLSLLNSRPRYGYDIMSTLGQWEQLAVTEGTLYPLMRRLQKEEHVDAFWQESEMGPPRKFYRLTPSGQALLELMQREWHKLTAAVQELQENKEDI